jgi:hypothetical protein
MVEDVRLAVNGARPVEFFSRVGGNVPSLDEVLNVVRTLAKNHSLQLRPEQECVAHV